VATLAIELQDGFRGDDVVVRAAGHEERLEGVTTNLAISRAAGVELEVPDGPVDVEVAVPVRGLSVRRRIDARDRAYVVVNATADRLEAEPSPEPPRYL
jgi:hypothetical protein